MGNILTFYEVRRILVRSALTLNICRLAKAELYLTLANVFHQFDMKLFETTRADVDPKRDCFVPGLEEESKGVRVLIR